MDNQFDSIVPPGSASLVLGKGGTGKTTLGIQFLTEGAKKGERGLLILGEQSKQSIISYFNHLNLDQYVKENSIVILDSSKSKIAVPGSFPGANIVSTLRAEFNSTMIQVFEEIENEGIKRLVMDSLQSFLILSTGSTYPLTEGSFSPIRDLIFKIVDLCRRFGVTSIFISEVGNTGRAPLGFEEYIVDGVVILSKDKRKNKKIREITIDKMRGVRIGQDTFLATMEGGKIRAFPPYRPKMPAITLQPEPIRDPTIDYISTGIMDLDKIIGSGYEKGSWNLIDGAPGAGSLREIAVPLFTNHLNLGRGLVIVVPEGTSAESNRRMLEHFVGKQRFDEQVIFFEWSPKEDDTRVEVLVDDVALAFNKIQSVREELREQYGTPVLTFLGLGKLEHMYDFENLVAEIGKEVANSRTARDVTVAFAKEGYRCTEIVSHMATTYWKLETIHKALTIHGIIPQTEYYAVELDVSKGYLAPQLISVV